MVGIYLHFLDIPLLLADLRWDDFLYGTYPCKFFQCRQSDAGSLVSNLQSTQMKGFASVLSWTCQTGNWWTYSETEKNMYWTPWICVAKFDFCQALKRQPSQGQEYFLAKKKKHVKQRIKATHTKCILGIQTWIMYFNVSIKIHDSSLWHVAFPAKDSTAYLTNVIFLLQPWQHISMQTAERQ